MKEHIDEMTKVLVDYTEKNHIMASHVILEDYAEQLYNAGYRKQEWISVEERLPEQHGRYMAYRADGSVCFVFFAGIRFPPYVTHWMPLPEAPKMKGGAE
ncbi:MAG: hypothetical protein J6V20_01640 [Bacteroidaceae bacterium]|nr:hypothetical protein [Bacteroidaceae bacterium]